MKGLCVLVTDACSGVGWAISRLLADRGCHVVGVAGDEEPIEFPGILYQCPPHDAGRMADMLRAIREKYPIDAIVNNTGLNVPAPLGEVSLTDLYDVFDRNVRTALQVTQALQENMRVRRAGRIVNVCHHGWWGQATESTAYAVASAALAACTRAWALELADAGVTVNAVLAGPVETEDFRERHPLGSEAEKQALAQLPLGRLGAAEEVAGVVAFLLQRESAFMTGQVIAVDGGAGLRRPTF
ncbi:SDR family oxidoreductase [Kerstersia gyiorum]|jgi:NAD(P)-dependent dehydrogenase (short-subunit alcohol dehydrogenase family)|uniref:NAD(P)-dependent dehydrogenase (Short-subunit alcohol dehydrogenase family) n=1 Tax=Kerstersia gyiorum TaxID=206506 RepID=A0A171KNP3_9BURK|nr:SDR family oxidoreductase [Kerstersia gyiorum]AZV94212.1 short-chain dehydrogenase [Bordetella sp. J329]MCO7640541.1 SDR family oxidoreductase [Pseudomonas sp. S 311-6]KAB0541685.1 SDR family oxidoreductase [Kerstersia gyiorum]KKO70510.1 short-chain dehydrogenase [Kerstersia gyiorum]MCH4270766.1 SDR family oxidoreductase [Kerstersia gyiorum]